MSRDLPPTIIVDTREQTPYLFDGSGIEVVRECLPVADYGVRGLPSVAIERKSLADFVGSVTFERDRFWRELAKLQAYRVRAVVVEASFDEILAGCYRSRATPQSIVASALAIQTDFQIPVLLAGDRGNAERSVLWILRRAWAKRVELGLVDQEVAA